MCRLFEIGKLTKDLAFRLGDALIVGLALQTDKPAQGKRKAPEPSQDVGDDSDDELSSEDAPLPGEEDPEDSSVSDEDIIEQDDDDDEELADEQESDDEAEGPEQPVSRPAGRLPVSQQLDRRRQQPPDPVEEDAESDDDMDKGAAFSSEHLLEYQQYGQSLTSLCAAS